MPYSQYWDFTDVLDVVRNLGSGALRFVTKPWLPEKLPDWAIPENKRLQKGVTGVYKGVIQPSSNIANAVLLGLPYSTALRGVGKMARTGKYFSNANKLELSEGAELLNKALYGSLLSSPQTGIKAGLGSIVGALTGAVERAGAGHPEDTWKIIRNLSPDVSIPNFIKGFQLRGTHRVPLRSINPQSKSLLDVPSRIMGGIDTATVYAMMKGRIPLEHAERLTLAGTPETPLGRATIGFLRRIPFSSFPVPFGRVGIHSIEQSGLFQPFQHPFRAGTSLALGGLAGYFGDKVPSEYSPYVSAAAGPFTLPVAIGLAARHSLEAGRDPTSEIIKEVARNIPYPTNLDPVSALLPENVIRSLTPNLLRDIARATDPEERKLSAPKGSGLFGSLLGFETTRAKIPGLREQLPITGRKVDIYGKSIAGRRESQFKRFLTSEPWLPDITPETPEVQKMQDIGVKMNAPSFEPSIKISGGEKTLTNPKGTIDVPLAPEESELYRQEQRAALQTVLQRLSKSPTFNSLTEKEQKVVAETVFRETIRVNKKAAKERALKRWIESRKGGFNK